VSRQQRAIQTRTRILQAAEACFASAGYDATGVAEVCERAGISKGAFYHHFPSKQAAFFALLQGWLEELDAEIVDSVWHADDVPAALRHMSGMIERVLKAAGNQLPIFLDFWARAAREPALWEATNAPYRRYRGLIADLIAAGVAQGTIRAVDPALVARVLVAYAVGTLLQGLLDPTETDWGHVGREGIQLLLQGLEARPNADESGAAADMQSGCRDSIRAAERSGKVVRT